MAGRRKLRPAEQTGNIFRAIFAPVFICFFSTFSFAAEDLPTYEDINNLSTKAKQVSNDFRERTGQLRLKFDFCCGLLSEGDRKTLSRLSRETADALTDIEAKQDNLRTRIEQYEGPDWEKRFGSTGLWRKLVGDLYESCLSEGETGIYFALTADKQQRQILLRKILEKLRVSEGVSKSARLSFLKAKILASLCEYDSNYLPTAKKEFESLLQDPHLDQTNIFRIELESIRLLGESEPGRLDNLSKKIADSNCGDIELILSLASTQRKLKSQQCFQRTLSKWPQIESAVGLLLLYELCLYEREGLQEATVIEACLAVKAAQAQGPEKYKTFLDALTAIDKFRIPLVLYVAAMSCADEKPDKAIDLLISAATAHKSEACNGLEFNPEQIAHQAVALAHQKYVLNRLDCNCVLKTYDDYRVIAGDIKDEQLLYRYVYVMERCNKQEKAKSLLKALAENGKGYWSKRARLDLIEQAIEQGKRQNAPVPDELCKKIAEFIEKFDGSDPCSFALRSKATGALEAEALTIYCQLMLERNEKKYLQEVVDVLTEDRLNNDPNLNLFKAIASRRLDRLNSSAVFFLRAFESEGCQIAPEATELLSQVIEQIDILQEENDKFIETTENCRKLALQCCRCLEGPQKRQAVLLLAEISVFAANGNSHRLNEAEKLLDDLNENYDSSSEPNLIRCRARILTSQSRFEEAVKLWEKLSQICKNEHKNNESKDRHWWQAKYYELFCCLNIAKTDRQKVLHTIEVLENTYKQIPDFWAKKLTRLKINATNKE